jgi:alpha-beta hydrolase superfamily lysophospholipase
LVSIPQWFGEYKQFGWMHLPDSGRARAGVVLCPSLGSEATWFHYALRLLAEDLEGRGFAVLRFDYPGTGHSAGDLKRSWPAGVLTAGARAALAHVRETGIESVAAVGFRLGGLVAASVVGGGSPDALVLWDPITSGRQFLRHQRAIRLLAVDPAFDPAMEDTAVSADDFGIAGYVFPSGAEQDITELDLARSQRRRGPVLILAEGDGGLLRRRPMAILEDAEIQPGEGVNSLLGSGRHPVATIARIGDYLDRHLPAAKVQFRTPPAAATVTVGSGAGGAVVETAETLGGIGLFAVATRPAAGDRPGSPHAVFVNTSYEPCVGPGRLWVELARDLAARGATVYRVDLSGLGDSPGRPGQGRFVPYQLEAIDDLVEAVQGLAGDTVPVLAGSCSGAYNVLEAARHLGRVKVLAVNPVLDAPMAGSEARGSVGRAVSVPRRPWVRALQTHPGVKSWARRLPEWVWRILDATRVQPSPARGLRPLAAADTETVVVCGPSHWPHYQRRGGWLVRPLVATGRLRLVMAPDLDHGVLRSSGQAVVRQVVLEEIAPVAGGHAAGAGP